MDSKISILILTKILNEHLLELTKRCVESLRGQADETIIIDGASPISYTPKGTKIIRLKEDPGFISCLNMGIDEAIGDHVVFCSNDTELISGKIADLCQDGLAFPKVNWVPPSYVPDKWHGGFYGFPKDDFYKHSTDYNYYYSDTDLFERAKIKGIPFYRVESVVINHRVNSTTNKTGGRSKWYDVDKEIFRKKYGYADD